MTMEVPIRRLRVREISNGTSPVVRESTFLSIGRPTEVGREREIEVGGDDSQVSRVALTVTARPDCWEVCVTNLHGAIIHPWGQPPLPARREKLLQFHWPLLGIRLVTDKTRSQHWVLLEASDLRVTPEHACPAPDTTRTTGTTQGREKVRDLTAKQLAALETTFEPHLKWPPESGQLLPRQLTQTAKRLGVSDAAIQWRLTGARDRAIRAGLVGEVGLLDPAYLFVLVAKGYVRAPDVDLA